jgi:hypothetical protein
MQLSLEDWPTALHLLDEALELPLAARESWLRTLPGEHQRLRPALQQLLDDRRAIETGDFLHQLPPLPAAENTESALAAGAAVGPWTLLRELGSGGMASVWLARRSDGAHQREVALKLPHRHIGTRAFVARFERERAILSTLNHPNIAAVLDAGSDGGQPWLALAYVDGKPITEAAAGLPLRAKLQLFLPVLQAVQHAHGQLVIHRDIKPANVLVDAAGRVQLLDFGVAKLLQGEGAEGVAEETALTQLGGRAMTPQYASPEQVAGRPLGVASDVYSLGVLLYELLTGQRPYKLQRDTAAALEEAILKAEVRKPSAAVANVSGDGHSSELRFKQLSRQLNGDIDTIVMKAMAVEPAARYASAAAFADDITRYLNAQPIAARPASWAYRAGRLLQRQKLAFSAAAVVLLALVGGAGVATWQAQRARAEATQAQAVQAFLTKVLAYNDPQQAQGKERSARELLELAAAQIDTDFKNQPAVRARLHQTVGTLFFEMGAFKPAAQHLQQALDLRLSNDAERVEALFFLAQAQRDLRDFPAAQASFAQALAAGNALGTQPHRWTGRILASQAWLASQTGQLDQALPLADEALKQQRAFSGEHSVDFLSVAQNVAALQIARGKIDEAQALIAVIEREVPTLPAFPAFPITDLLVTRAQLASVRFVRGEYAKAEADYRALLPQLDQHIGKSFDRTAIARSTYARALAELGRADEALAVQQGNIANVQPRAAAEPEAVNLVRLQMVRLLTVAGRAPEAEALGRELLQFLEAKYPEPTRYRESARAFVADAVLAQGRREEGVKLLQASLNFAAQMGKADNPVERANKQWQLALATRHEAAAPTLAGSACQTMTAALGPTNPRVLKCLAVSQWVHALHAPPAERAAALAAYTAARQAAVAGLAEGHALRAELLAAEAEIASGLGRAPSRLMSLH